MSINRFLLYFRTLYKLNIIKTLYFNFKLLKLKDAIKLPFLFFGNVKLGKLSGNVLFTVPVETGIFRWGVDYEGFAPSNMPSSFSLGKHAILEIRGRSDVACGVVFRISGHLILSKGSFIGSKSIVVCDKKISIGICSRIAFGSVLMDTNHHFVIYNNQVTPREKAITIGDYCWIGNNSTIGKGCVLPNNTIIAAKSFISKDYTELGENCLLAGCPAKVKQNGIRRLYNIEIEENIQEYFNAHKDVKFYYLSEEEKNRSNYIRNNL